MISTLYKVGDAINTATHQSMWQLVHDIVPINGVALVWFSLRTPVNNSVRHFVGTTITNHILDHEIYN